MKLFVTGGSGFVGRSFIEYVLKNHPEFHAIAALSRSNASDQAILTAGGAKSSQIQIVRGGLDDVSVLQKGLEGCHAVFHIAAKVEIWGKWEDFVQANIVGTQNLIAASKTAGVKRFVHVSTEATLVSGFQNGCLLNVDETAPLSLEPPFYAPYTKSKALTEKLVLESNDTQNGFDTVVVKPRFVWGKGDTKVIPEIERAIHDGRFKWFTPEVKSSTCHIANLCEGMILAFRNGKPANAYFLTDGEAGLFNDIIKQLLGPSIDLSGVGSLSSSVAWYLAVLLENLPFMGYGVTREPPINRQVLCLLAQDVIIKDDKARRELGYTSHMSKEEGIREFVEWRAAIKKEETK